MTYWNTTQYLKFSDHRLRPAFELLERIPLDSQKMVFDLGLSPMIAGTEIARPGFGLGIQAFELKKGQHKEETPLQTRCRDVLASHLDVYRLKENRP